jgi:L-malate glycosyltransferase
MRILQTAETYSPTLGGVAEVVRNISERLARRGHEVHVATTAVNSHSSYAEISGVHVHRFKMRGNLALGMHGEVERYRDFVRSRNWDLLVNHCLQVWPTDALLPQIATYPWPSVLVTHGVLIDNPIFQKYFGAIPLYISAYRRWSCVSEVSGEFAFATKFRLPRPTVIPNGVDLDEWSRATLELRCAWDIGEKPWVINVSTHSPLKAHRDFFRLANCLRRHGVCSTLIAGTYPMSKWGMGDLGFSGGCAYECQLRASLPGNAVDLRTNLPRHQVVSAIQEADILVSTSHLESYSIVLLESMAAGKPWISFDVGTARQNAGGIVARNWLHMAEILGELVRNPEQRRQLGANGRAQILARHDWDSIVDRYEQLYEEVLRANIVSVSTPVNASSLKEQAFQ